MAALTLRKDGDRIYNETFIDRYVQWAETITDAPKQYHYLNAVVILSTIMSPNAALPTMYGEIRPNIWAMILAGTTITRKSTTMDMALRVLDDVHPDYLMATDGSPEGLLGELAHRDGKVSLFHKDEITGFIDSAKSKDYLAGILESMTRLYDGRKEKRILRRESIEINKPRFVILSGGIKTRMQEITSIENIRSGFIPRFLMVSGTTSVSMQRETGPPIKDVEGNDPREKVLEELIQIVNLWIPSPQTEVVIVGGMKKKIEKKAQSLNMSATPEAWDRIRLMQRNVLTLAEKSHSVEIFMPMYQRLGDSIVKVAMLIAGSELRTEINLVDVCTAIGYSDDWLRTATEFATEVENQPDYNIWEKKALKIIKYIISKYPEAVSRSEMMRKFHVRQKDIEDIEKTLVARGQIKIEVIQPGENHRGNAKKARTVYQPIEGIEFGSQDTYRV